MILFSSITAELQIIIAEKIGYFDQQEFELSSKLGKKIVKRTKRKAVVELFEIDLNEKFMHFHFKYFKREMEWSKLREVTNLPRFLLWMISINVGSYILFQSTTTYRKQDIDSVHFLSELKDTVYFVENKVHLDCKDTISTPILDVIGEISKIGMFTTGTIIDPAVLEHSALIEIDVVDIGVQCIPNEVLLQLKTTSTSFREFTDSGRIQVLANLMFKQWFQGERQIDWLYMCVGRNPLIKAYEKQMFRGLPYLPVLLYNNERKQERFKKLRSIPKRKKFTILNAIGTREQFSLYPGDGVYSIDRADTKLLVYHSNEYGFIMAQEYTKLGDVFEIASEL